MSALQKSLIIFFTLVMASIFYILKSDTPSINGDGREYILMSQSYLNHSSPKLTDGDIYSAINHSGMNESYFSIPNGVNNLDKYKLGFFEGKDNKLYSYHFSFYSMINSPFLYLTNHLGHEQTKSFYITNSILLIASFLFLLFFMTASIHIRLLCCILILTPTTLGYLKWPSPEIFTFSLMTIGLVLFNNKRYYLSSFVLAIGSLQNQPVAVASFFVYLTGFIITNKPYFYGVAKKNTVCIKQVISSIIYGVPSAILILTPSLFYYSKFGTPNLIASLGAASSDYVTINRFKSIFLDLNQGMILLHPVIFIVFPILIGILLTVTKKVNDKTELIHIFCLIFILIFCSLLCLSTINWNSGAFNVMRYVYWLSVPLIFILASLIKLINNNRIKVWIIYLSIIASFLINLLQPITGWFAIDHVHNNKISEYLYFNKPNIYNPVPEIYIERSSNKEVSMFDEIKKTYFPAYVKNGWVLKSISPKQLTYNDSNLCSEPSTFNRKDNETDGWVYHNYLKPCEAITGIYGNEVIGLPSIPLEKGNKIDFDSFAFSKSLGWSFPEDANKSIWSDGVKSSIIVSLQKKHDELKKHIIKFNGFAYKDQSVDVFIDDKKLKTIYIKNISNGFVLSIPDTFITKKYTTISFVWGNPKEITNDDKRQISFYLKSFELLN